MNIRAIPRTYAGVRFRSTLEADWAATLDELGIVWQYEPEGVTLPSGELYLPDFYLPRIATWLEVKGPHNERIEKTKELARAVADCGDCKDTFPYEGRCYGTYQLVVIGYAAVKGMAAWSLLGFDGEPIYGGDALNQCKSCKAFYFYGPGGPFGCRAHRRYGWEDADLDREYSPASLNRSRWSGDLRFVRSKNTTDQW